MANISATKTSKYLFFHVAGILGLIENDFDTIIIEDCILHDSTNDTVKVKPNCNNITIRYNEIYNSGRAFTGYANFDTGERNSEGIDNVNGDNMTVQNNYIHDICSTAIYAKGGAMDALIENNYIERAYAAGVMVGFDTSPEYFDLTVNPQYYENIRGVVRNNLIVDVGWEGIGLYAAKDAQVYNNTIINAVTYGRGRYHSPIYFGVATQDWGNPTGCPPSVNPSIHHNIVIQPSTYNNRMIDIRYATGVYSFGLSALSGLPTMHNNCYYVAGKSAAFSDNRPGSLLNNAGLNAWKTHINGESGTIEVNPALGADYLPTNQQCAGMGFLGLGSPPILPTNVAPAISGGQAAMSLTAGYGATYTSAFTVSGQPVPTVTLNTTHSNRVTWNSGASRLDIAAGLAAGSYPVVITATNVAGTATFTFTLTVNSGGGGTPAGTYNIADFYNQSGQLAVIKGDIIIVGDRQYRVLSNTYTISYWSQNSLTSAISWWTAYMNSFVAGGVVEEITVTQPNIAPTISGGQAAMSLSAGYGATYTSAFTVAGNPAPTVSLNTTHGNRITWNSTASRLDIATGLAAGSYPVVLSATNAAGTATFTFTLTVTSGGGGAPAGTYNIADFYNKNGQLSVVKGDIIVVGTKQYKVLSNTYTISYWSQNTLTAAISWWTAYMDSYAASGVVVLI